MLPAGHPAVNTRPERVRACDPSPRREGCSRDDTALQMFTSAGPSALARASGQWHGGRHGTGPRCARGRPPMKAAVHTRYGPPDVVRVSDVDMPAVKEHDVLVKVHATTVNNFTRIFNVIGITIAKDTLNATQVAYKTVRAAGRAAAGRADAPASRCRACPRPGCRSDRRDLSGGNRPAMPARRPQSHHGWHGGETSRGPRGAAARPGDVPGYAGRVLRREPGRRAGVRGGTDRAPR